MRPTSVRPRSCCLSTLDDPTLSLTPPTTYNSITPPPSPSSTSKTLKKIRSSTRPPTKTMQSYATLLAASRISTTPPLYHAWKSTWPRSNLCGDCGNRVRPGLNSLECLSCDQVAHRSCQVQDFEVKGVKISKSGIVPTACVYDVFV